MTGHHDRANGFTIGLNEDTIDDANNMSDDYEKLESDA